MSCLSCIKIKFKYIYSLLSTVAELMLTNHIITISHLKVGQISQKQMARESGKPNVFGGQIDLIKNNQYIMEGLSHFLSTFIWGTI